MRRGSWLPMTGFSRLLAYGRLTGLRLSRLSRLEAAIADDRSTVLVADDNETLVGFATVYLDIVSVRFGQRAWVEDLAVAPHRRSSGIGKALLDAAKAWARDHGAARLELESGPARVDAHRFYERERPDGWSRCFRWTL